MKNNSFIILFLICIAPMIFSGCASQETPEADNPVSKNVMDQAVPGEMPLNGGYSETSTDSENVKESLSFLKKELSVSYPEITLIKVQRAEIQIVSGWKTRLFCEYSIGESKKLYLLQAVIYKDPNLNKTLKELEFDK